MVLDWKVTKVMALRGSASNHSSVSRSQKGEKEIALAPDHMMSQKKRKKRERDKHRRWDHITVFSLTFHIISDYLHSFTFFTRIKKNMRKYDKHDWNRKASPGECESR
jgi:hypothetical protein